MGKDTGPIQCNDAEVDVETGWETILSYVKTNLQVHSRDCPILM